MKRYLFDKIEIDGGVKFIPFRKANIIESFSAFTNMTFNQDEWEFRPTSFKDFLKMLEKTKLAYGEDYEVVVNLPMRKEQMTFEDALQAYATEYYSDIPVNEEELAKFYTSAYEIKAAAIENRKLLEVSPADYAKEKEV